MDLKEAQKDYQGTSIYSTHGCSSYKLIILIPQPRLLLLPLFCLLRVSAARGSFLICAEAHQSSQARRDQVISAEEWRVGWQELEALRGSEEEMKWKMNLGGCKSSSHSYKLFVATYEDLDKMLLAYTTPMDTALYWCILTNMIGLASILFFADQLQRCYIPMGEKPVSMGVAGWYVLSALLQQSEDLLGCGTGSNTYPISSAAWVTYRVGCGVSLIVYTSYSATLVSHLAVEQSVTLPFSNLQELSRQSGWDAGCNNNDLFKKVVLRSPDNLVNSYTEGLEKVLNGKSFTAPTVRDWRRS
ncbi:hypothetical protein O3P69_016288 [Scylla paramamosain]|uniref:Uncharacterized protein n=1 Tax=Scylla paramamosain TaxID=85552 RepID=A0AAW0S9D7_SCYPA